MRESVNALDCELPGASSRIAMTGHRGASGTGKAGSARRRLRSRVVHRVEWGSIVCHASGAERRPEASSTTKCIWAMHFRPRAAVRV